MNADQSLYDSLYHSAAVVGLNTSAMIEAAIVERPVYTITLPEYAGCQAGTVHFGYVLAERGGTVSVSSTFQEHLQQLSQAPHATGETRERARRFLASFVRPHGLDTPASRIMVDEIERAASLQKTRAGAPLWHAPVRWGLQAMLRV
jgi:hypothetical protein